MNLNDITQRLERIHTSIEESIDENLYNHLYIVVDSNTKQPLGIKLDPKGKKDIEHRILTIIHSIASLKDHLKSKIGKEIEKEINKCLALQLTIDLDNSDKHGYPTKKYSPLSKSMEKYSRSGKFPKIEKPNRTINVKKGDTWSFNTSYKISISADQKKFTQIATTTIDIDNGCIKINAEIVDENGKFIMSFNQMIEEAMEKWQEIINNGL